MKTTCGGCISLHSYPDSQAPHSKHQLNGSFTGFYDVVTNTLSFLQTCTFVWPKYPEMTFRLFCPMYLSLGLLHFCRPKKSGRRCTLSPRICVDVCGSEWTWSVLQYLIRMCSSIKLHFTTQQLQPQPNRSFSSMLWDDNSEESAMRYLIFSF